MTYALIIPSYTLRNRMTFAAQKHLSGKFRTHPGTVSKRSGNGLAMVTLEGEPLRLPNKLAVSWRDDRSTSSLVEQAEPLIADAEASLSEYLATTLVPLKNPTEGMHAILCLASPLYKPNPFLFNRPYQVQVNGCIQHGTYKGKYSISYEYVLTLGSGTEQVERAKTFEATVDLDSLFEDSCNKEVIEFTHNAEEALRKSIYTLTTGGEPEVEGYFVEEVLKPARTIRPKQSSVAEPGEVGFWRDKCIALLESQAQDMRMEISDLKNQNKALQDRILVIGRALHN